VFLIDNCFGGGSAQIFAKFPNKYFIETGTFGGEGVIQALTSEKFQKIYSIELSEDFYLSAVNRFKDNPRVTIVYGDSGKVLPRVLSKIDAPATFWLDGHYSHCDTARGEENTPLLKELEAIKQHSINTHTILIDDIRCCNTEDFDYLLLETLCEKLRDINPNYIIEKIDGTEFLQDILVAYLVGEESCE